MPLITLPFNYELNASLQIGDVAYYVSTTQNAAFDVNSSDVVLIGTIVDIDFNPPSQSITCDTMLTQDDWPIQGDFILFSKDNKANMSSLLGYHAKVKIRNNSKTKAEMFRVSADYFESSK
tara:strand:- start:140 stop:502 length:363 start_codon:yes stop_codon:yes gene_type:complete